MKVSGVDTSNSISLVSSNTSVVLPFSLTTPGAVRIGEGSLVSMEHSLVLGDALFREFFRQGKSRIGSDGLCAILSFVSSCVSQSTACAYLSSLTFPDQCSTNAGQLGGSAAPLRYDTVVNSSSNTTWNCGLTCPVCRLRTSATFPAWWGEWARYTPVRNYGAHLGIPNPPGWFSTSSTKTGRPQVW